MVAEEVEKIKKDSSKAVKMSKRSTEILKTSVCEKMLSIFQALDFDQDGVLSLGDLEKTLSGRLSEVFQPFVKTVANIQKPMDSSSFETSFRRFLRVDFL